MYGRHYVYRKAFNHYSRSQPNHLRSDGPPYCDNWTWKTLLKTLAALFVLFCIMCVAF